MKQFISFLVSLLYATTLLAAPQGLHNDTKTGLVSETPVKFGLSQVYLNGTLLETLLAAKQPLDSDLTAVAALATTSFGRGLLPLSDAAAVRAYIGSGVSSFDGVFSSLSDKPTTIAGYGITDLNSLGDARWSLLAHTHTFSSLTSKPTTLSGFGITDGQPLDSDLTSIAALSTTSFGRGLLPLADAAATRTYIGAGTSSFSGAFSSLSGIPTTIAGYGITDALAKGEVRRTTAQGVTTSYPSAGNTDTQRGTALATAWAALQIGDQVDLGPGVYEMANPIEMKAGVTLDGHGATMKFAAQGTGSWGLAGGHTATIIWGGGGAGRSNDCHVKNILFDCNMANQTATDATVGAVFIYGGNYSTIENCRAINWGTKGSVECFCFSIACYDDGGKSFGNKIINCEVDTPASIVHGVGGTTAITIFGSDPGGGDGITPVQGWAFGAEITGCFVHDVESAVGGASGKPANFNAYGIGFGSGGRVHHNRAYNITSPGGAFANGYYADTGTQRDLTIEDNDFLNVRHGIIFAIAQSATAIVTEVDIINNRIVAEAGISLSNEGTPSYTFKNRIAGNFIRATTNYGIYLYKCTQNMISNNTVDGPTAPIFEHTGATGNTFFGNHTSVGAVTGTPTPLTLAEGGTNAATATAARSSLGLNNPDRAGLGDSSGERVYSYGAYGIWDAANGGVTLTIDDSNFVCGAVNINDINTLADWRSALGLSIGSNVQAYDADLTTWAGVTPGTGVATALAANLGSVGAAMTNGGGGATTCTGATIGSGSKTNAGFVTATTTGSSTVVVTFPFTAPTGWTIMATDMTSGVQMTQSAKSTTTATFVGVTSSGDVIQYIAMAY